MNFFRWLFSKKPPISPEDHKRIEYDMRPEKIDIAYARPELIEAASYFLFEDMEKLRREFGIGENYRPD